MRSLIFLVSFFILFSAQAETPLRLALNWKPEPQFGGFYAADPHFKKANLNVQVMPGGSGTPTAQMLPAGQAEYAIVSADELILAWDRGSKEMIAVFAAYQTNPQGIMFRTDKNYDSVASIFKDKNSTLLWQAGLPYAMFLQKKYGKPAGKTAPYAGGITNFINDEKINQQCFVTSEPLTAKKSGLDVKSFLIADAGYNPYTTVLVTTKKRFKERPAEVEAVVSAVRQGWMDYVKDPRPTNAKMVKLNPAMDLKTMDDSAQAQLPLIETEETKTLGLGAMTETRWQTLADQLLDLKLVKAKVPAKELFTTPGLPRSQ